MGRTSYRTAQKSWYNQQRARAANGEIEAHRVVPVSPMIKMEGQTSPELAVKPYRARRAFKTAALQSPRMRLRWAVPIRIIQTTHAGVTARERTGSIHEPIADIYRASRRDVADDDRCDAGRNPGIS